MTKKTTSELAQIVPVLLDTLSELRVRSESARQRSRSYLLLLLIAVKYPKALPKDFGKRVAESLVRLDDDTDAQFIVRYFPEYETLVNNDVDEHAIRHAEEVPLPKELRRG